MHSKDKTSITIPMEYFRTSEFDCEGAFDGGREKVAIVTPKETMMTENTCTRLYLLFRKKNPNSMDTGRPAERKTIKTVRGTLKAKAQLFNRDPVDKTSTWVAQFLSGTCRGLSRGIHVSGEEVMNDGSDCREMNIIWEKVSAEPIRGLSRRRFS